MTYCDVCEKEIDRRSFGGHRSGHTRRGELQKRQKRKFECLKCGLEFENGNKLFGHTKNCGIDFETIRTNGRRRKVLLKERPECWICQSTVWMGKTITLQMDHIDGDPDNNTKENLRLLCPNCHSQTDTFCAKNRGRPKSSRDDKRKKYKYRLTLATPNGGHFLRTKAWERSTRSASSTPIPEQVWCVTR